MKYRLIIDIERCKGCELCVAVCPKQVLELGKAHNARGSHFAIPSHAENCIGCLQCCDICPDAAIEIERRED